MIDLLNAVADANPGYEDFSVWGFAKTVRPWQRQSAIVRLGRNVELVVRFDLDGLEVCAAWWYGPSEQIQRYRAAVADHGRGRRLATIVRTLERDGFTITGDVMTRPPRGYSADHPRAALLRRRSLIALQSLGCEDWLHTAAAVDHVLATFTQLHPLAVWLVENVSHPHE